MGKPSVSTDYAEMYEIVLEFFHGIDTRRVILCQYPRLNNGGMYGSFGWLRHLEGVMYGIEQLDWRFLTHFQMGVSSPDTQ